MNEQEFNLDFSDDKFVEDTKSTTSSENNDNIIERINKSDLVPLFDTNHEHVYVRDEEETDDYYVEVCSVGKCGIGRLIAKD